MQCIDIRKYFDKENLRDAFNTLYSAGVQGKVYRLWYKLNQNTRIAVKTGVGLTDERDTGETLGQGTVGGALASALNIDEELNAHFEESHGLVRLQPLSFQDDVIRMCPGRAGAQEGYHKFEAVFKSKLLEIHPTKSCFILFSNDNKMRSKIENEINQQPLIYDDFTVNKSSGEKWLGDMLSDAGLMKSVEATVKNRYGRILSAIFEMKSVLEDLRLQMIGGLKCGLDIWEMAIIPSLLNNAGTWTHISGQALESVNKLQNMFLQNLFSVSRSCPKAALCWDTATTMMQVRVEKAKLGLVHHIRSLEDNSLARQIYMEQLSQGWPGLVTECQELIEKWKIPNIINEEIDIPKNEWKGILRRETKIQNGFLLTKLVNKSSKLEIMKNETFEEEKVSNRDDYV